MESFKITLRTGQDLHQCKYSPKVFFRLKNLSSLPPTRAPALRSYAHSLLTRNSIVMPRIRSLPTGQAGVRHQERKRPVRYLLAPSTLLATEGERNAKLLFCISEPSPAHRRGQGVRNWRKALALVRRECIPTRRVNALQSRNEPIYMHMF